MNIKPSRIGAALDILGCAQLNDAEQLRLAEKLIENVFTKVCPMTDPQMCIAEGYLASASHAVEQARLLVESWPHDDLPFDPDLDSENRRPTLTEVNQDANSCPDCRGAQFCHRHAAMARAANYGMKRV